MSLIAILVGSRHADSPTRGLAEFAAEKLDESGHETFLVDISSVPPAVLIDGATAHPSVNDVVTTVDSADALIIVAPVVKHAYSATAKLMVELLPESALGLKPALILSTGDTAPTQLPSDLESTLLAMGGGVITPSVNVSEYDITRHTCSTALEEIAEAAVQQSLSLLVQALGNSALVTAPKTPGGVLVEPEDALDAFRAGALLLDVRSRPHEGVGFISGAIYVRKRDVEAVFSPERLHHLALHEKTPIVVFCNSEHGSVGPLSTLTRLGYEAVTHVRGGAQALHAAMLRSSELSR